MPQIFARRSAVRLFTVSALILAGASVAASVAHGKSAIRVGIADQNPRMFAAPAFSNLGIKRTRYLVPANVMQNSKALADAHAFVVAARERGISVLLHIASNDSTVARGPFVSPSAYKRNAASIVRYFGALGVREFGSWNSVNFKSGGITPPGNAVSYFKSMYLAVKEYCQGCVVVGLDLIGVAGESEGSETAYIRDFYRRLSEVWRKRLAIVGIHNYVDVSLGRSRTRDIITTVRRLNPRTRFWYTETGAFAAYCPYAPSCSTQGRSVSFPYDEARQARDIGSMLALARRFEVSGVERVYVNNWFGTQDATCASTCRLDLGLVGLDGQPRPAYVALATLLTGYSH